MLEFGGGKSLPVFFRSNDLLGSALKPLATEEIRIGNMRIIFTAILITAVCATAADSQQLNRPVKKTDANAQQIIQFMNDWTRLSNRHDLTALGRLLPAGLVLTFQDGQMQTRDEYLTALQKNPADFTIRNLDQKVDLYGSSVAVIRSLYEVAVGAVKGEFRNTTTFLKRRGHWQPIAFHSSALVK